MTEYGVAWTLRLPSFAGFALGASHYYAKLSGRTEDVTVEFVMTEEDAAAVSTPDFTFHAGETSERFRSKRDAIGAAVATFRSLAGPRDILVRDYGEPGEIVDGPDDLVEEAVAAADVSEDEWYRWVGRFTEHEYDTQFGHGAPPSVRREIEIVVARSGEHGWTVNPENARTGS